MDRRGAKPVMAVCLSLIGLSYLLRPLMSELWHWYALSLLQFVGFSGAAALPAGRLVGIWFRKTRGRMMGFAAMGNNFGGLVVPPVVGAALTAAAWQGAYLALAAMAFAVVLLALAAIREFPTERDLARSGEDGGTPRGQDGRTVVLTGQTVRQAVRSRAFYAIMLAVLLGTFTYSTVLPQVTAHLTNEGHRVAVASAALSLLAIFGMLGKVVLGYLAERITTRRTLMIDLVGQAFFLVLMTYAASPLVMWVSVPMFGFFMGGFGALFQLIVQDTFGVRYFGSIMGLVNLTSVVSFLAGPLMAGLSFDMTGSYRLAFMSVAGLFVAASLVLTQARPAAGHEPVEAQ